MDTSEGSWYLAVLLPVLAIAIVIQVCFLLNLRDLLRQVSRQNQSMGPNQVWLNLIPLFSIFWMFVTVSKVRDSARAEFSSRRWTPSGDFGYGVGLAYAILSIPAWGFFGVAALVCFVIYWVRMSELKNQLKQSQPPAGWVPPQSHSGKWGQSADGVYPGLGGSSLQGPRRSCPSCGAAVGFSDVFCRSCGTATEVTPDATDTSAPTDGSTVADTSDTSAVTCPFCGAAYRPNAQFCSSCGRPVT